MYCYRFTILSSIQSHKLSISAIGMWIKVTSNGTVVMILISFSLQWIVNNCLSGKGHHH